MLRLGELIDFLYVLAGFLTRRSGLFRGFGIVALRESRGGEGACCRHQEKERGAHAADNAERSLDHGSLKSLGRFDREGTFP